MNKNEFEIKSAVIRANQIDSVLGLVKHLATLIAAILALQIIFDGFKPLIGQNPEAIAAFAKLVSAINPSNITGYFLAGVCAVGWKTERTGKQRAIRQKADLQEKIEASDKYRSSSGLDEAGQTPKVKK